MSNEICEDDYTMTPCGRLGGLISVAQSGKQLRQFAEMGDALQFIRDHMEKNQFWPSIWWISDHGNAWQVDLEGREIKQCKL